DTSSRRGPAAIRRWTSPLECGVIVSAAAIRPRLRLLRGDGPRHEASRAPARRPRLSDRLAVRACCGRTADRPGRAGALREAGTAPAVGAVLRVPRTEVEGARRPSP